MEEFHKNNALGINEVFEKYKSIDTTLKQYHDCLNIDEHPYLDNVLQMYTVKKEQLMMRRLEQAMHDLQVRVQETCNEGRRNKVLDRLRLKLSNKKRTH